MAENGLNCGTNKTVIMVTKITVPDIGDFNNVEIIEILVKSGDVIKKGEKILPETEKIIKEAESTITKKSTEPIIQEYEISDILSAVDSICKIEKKKSKTAKKDGFTDKDYVLILNNQAKTNKSEILVLDNMIE